MEETKRFMTSRMRATLHFTRALNDQKHYALTWGTCAEGVGQYIKLQDAEELRSYCREFAARHFDLSSFEIAKHEGDAILLLSKVLPAQMSDNNRRVGSLSLCWEMCSSDHCRISFGTVAQREDTFSSSTELYLFLLGELLLEPFSALASADDILEGYE